MLWQTVTLILYRHFTVKLTFMNVKCHTATESYKTPYKQLVKCIYIDP